MPHGKALHATQHVAGLLSRVLDNQFSREGERICLSL